MARSDDLKRERRRYQECLSNVTCTANSLSRSIATLKTLIEEQKEGYSVDDLGGGSNYLNYLLESENSIYSNIVNNIIPGTRNKISNLNWRIADAVQKEEMERRGA